MSTHKHFDKICCVVLALTVLLTIIFMNGELLGIEIASKVMGYESRLFDTSKVHTVNIIMDNWDDFIENCQSEEYYPCTVVIDNDAYKNVAIRGKGNTSLTQVASYGNDRYSFKIEFDRYDSTKKYYGLDKLCLNNIIQDNTYVKDYLVYQMMNSMGVSAPLCSYVYVSVNSEEWGLYLAVEGIEESFLQRNYSSNYGELYKPDSMSMGGGRGNGKGFDMENFSNPFDTDEKKQVENSDENTTLKSESTTQSVGENETTTAFENPNGFSSQMPNEKPDNNGGNFQNSDMTPPNAMGGEMGENNFPQGGMMEMPNKEADKNVEDFNGSFPEGGMTPPEMPQESENSSTIQNTEGALENEETTQPFDENNTDFKNNFSGDELKEIMNGKDNSGTGMSSDDVLLKYIDDNTESYSNIFDNAKTDITNSDKERLIASLKKLSLGEDLENTVDVEKVIKYFVVHNFVLNFDSYTGSMIHNYYLYEKDGKMQMIPWDYNLAFGGFQSAGGATSLVNYPIDSPVSGKSVEDRPMLSWIFESEEYTKLYHEYFREFISKYFDSGYFEEMIESVQNMISPYVESDPTKFCTFEEFQKGIATLKEFCLLRAESVTLQLNGTIGTTSESQNSETFVKADSIEISDMGSMNNSMGKGFDKNGEDKNFDFSNIDISNLPQMPNGVNGENDSENKSENSSDIESTKQKNQNGESSTNEETDKKDAKDFSFDKGMNNEVRPSQVNTEAVVMLFVSILILIIAIIIAFVFKRRKRQ